MGGMRTSRSMKLRSSNRINQKKIKPRHIIIKFSKVKDREFWKQQKKSNSSYAREIP